MQIIVSRLNNNTHFPQLNNTETLSSRLNINTEHKYLHPLPKVNNPSCIRSPTYYFCALITHPPSLGYSTLSGLMLISTSQFLKAQ